ncbi:MAG: hypothetical protein M5U34_11040 [Chloroflexi bacterium]|nr:hypothetical protein [Chloroflexota bacterium]
MDHLSFRLDMKILWLTVIKTIRREDISQQGQAAHGGVFWLKSIINRSTSCLPVRGGG